MLARFAGITERSPSRVVWRRVADFQHGVAAVDVRPKRWHVERFACVMAVAAQLGVFVAFPARRVHPVVVILAAWEHRATPAGRTSRGWINRDFAFLFRVHGRFHLLAVPALVSFGG